MIGAHNIIAAIQARMGSNRLPKKVMREILGKPMLWHIFRRLRTVSNITDVVISTTLNPLDKDIIEFAKEYKIKYYAGSENDIVDRMYQTAKYFDATALIRITADCPVVDPFIVENLVNSFLQNNFDYVSNWSPQKRTYPHGLEVEIYSISCLDRLWNEVKDPLLREWIPFNIHENPDKFDIKILENETDITEFRWTVDYKEDLILIEKIYSELYRDDYIFTMEDILKIIDTTPDLKKINDKYKEKKGVEGYIEQKKENLYD